MTTLPATVIEAQAVDYARQRIAYVRDGKLKLFGVEPGAWFEEGESREACRWALSHWIMRDVTNLMDAVAFARAGYELWEDCLRGLILEYKHRGVPMPTYLAAFDMELTRAVTFSRKAGRHRTSDFMRDLIVGIVVAMVKERFNLKPRRNPASRRPSACSIVAAALAAEGMAMSESNVRQLWEGMPQHFKTSKYSQWLSA